MLLYCIRHGRLLIVTIKALLGIDPYEPPYALENGSITTLQVSGAGVPMEQRRTATDQFDLPTQ